MPEPPDGLGRQPDAIVGLIVAVALLLGWDPGLATDLGFQLSVTATAGLILLSPAIERRLGWHAHERQLAEQAGECWCGELQ